MRPESMSRFDYLMRHDRVLAFEIPFGSLKGRKVSDVPKGDLFKFCLHVRSVAREQQKPIRGIVKTTLDNIEKYLWS